MASTFLHRLQLACKRRNGCTSALSVPPRKPTAQQPVLAVLRLSSIFTSSAICKKVALPKQKHKKIIDQLVIKCRLLRYLRTKDFDALFSGDPTWVTIVMAGMNMDGRSLVTKTDFRLLHTLTTLCEAPEPNLTVFWSDGLPEGFKHYAGRMSVKTSAIQFENDDLMRQHWGDDCAIGCCVSPMRMGKQMQYFGARANLAKALLYAINGGVDEITGATVARASSRLPANTSITMK